MKSTNNQFYQQTQKKNRPKSQLTTRHSMFRETNLRQSRKFYTSAAADAGEI